MRCLKVKNNSKAYPYNNVPQISDFRELVKYCGREYADKTAFRWIENKVEKSKTYKEFAEDVEALGTYLISKGYNRTHIAMIGETSYETILVYFAVINSGNVIVPIAKESTPEDLKYLYENSDSSVIVHTNSYSKEAKEVGCTSLINTNNINELLNEGRKLLSLGSDDYKNIKIDKDALAILLYTSGTTGFPKGVMISHSGLIFDIIATLENVSFPDSHFLMLPLHHVLAFGAGVVLPMFDGSEIFICSSMRNLVKELQYAKPKCIPCVPLILEAFYKKIEDNLKSSGKEKTIQTLTKITNALLVIGIDLRRKLFKKIIDALGGNLEMVLVGGAHVNEKLITDFTNFGVSVITGYGATELASAVTMRNKHFNPQCVGSVNPGIELRLVDGEIQLKSPALFLGYYKNEKATKEVFDGEWFKTGDLGEEKDGLIAIVGRIKNLIILPNGENVSPEELESKLMDNISNITEIIVKEMNGVIGAEIYSENSDNEIKRTIENKVFEYNKNLPSYKQIGLVVFRDTTFEKTTSNKIKRV